MFHIRTVHACWARIVHVTGFEPPTFDTVFATCVVGMVSCCYYWLRMQKTVCHPDSPRADEDHQTEESTNGFADDGIHGTSSSEHTDDIAAALICGDDVYDDVVQQPTCHNSTTTPVANATTTATPTGDNASAAAPPVASSTTHVFATSYVNALIEQVKHTLIAGPNAKQHIRRLLQQADDATMMVFPPEQEWFAQLQKVCGNVTSVCVRVPLTLRLPSTHSAGGTCMAVNKWFELEVRWTKGATDNHADPVAKSLVPIVERQLRQHSDVLEHVSSEMLQDKLMYRTSADYDPLLHTLLDVPTTHRVAAMLAGTLLGSLATVHECADIRDFAKTMRVLCEPCIVERTMAVLWEEADDDSSSSDESGDSSDDSRVDATAVSSSSPPLLHQPLVAVLGVITTQLPVPTLWETLQDVTTQAGGVFEYTLHDDGSSDTPTGDLTPVVAQTYAFYAVVPRAHGLCVEHTLRKRVRNYPDTTFTSSIARVEERGATMPIRAHPCLIEIA